MIALNILFRAFFIECLFFLRAHSVRFFGEFFRPRFLFSFRKGNGVEPPKEKRAWGNLSNGFPTPLLATKGLALGTCYVWKSEMHDGVSERRCAERGALSDDRDGWDGQRKTEIF